MKFSQLLNRKDSIKEKAQTAFVRASSLFDERWYASRYQDVFKKLKDPARHYYLVGWKENRNPSENFDTASYLRQYPECGICPIVFEHNRNDYADLAVCIIVKDEAPYIKEWLDYHLMVGVKRFYIYDNESFDNLKQVLLPYIRQGVVIYQYYPGEVMQLNCYRDCLKQYGDKNEWIAFIDADEFIIPMENATIPEFLADYKEYPAVGVNWVSYDSNGHKEKPKGGVMENYTRVHYDENMVPFHLIKSIVRPQEVSKVVNPHFFLYKGDKLAVNENKEEIGGDLSERAYISPFSTNKIRINHYYCKSRAEAEAKVLRGSSDRDIRRRKSISAKELNFPDYKYDYTAYKFVLQLNPEKAKIEEIKMAWLRLKNAFIEFKHTFNPSPLYDYIDEEWYFKQYPDAKKSGMSAAKHYVNIGWRKGYNPSKKFNTEFYLNKYKDVAKAHICPLLHYLNSGKNEGRLAYETDTVISATEPVSQPLLKHLSEWVKNLSKEKEREYNELWQNKAYFDENWYLKQYPDAKESGMSAKKHYDTIGWLQGYNPSAKFKTNEYLKQYPECKICPIDFEYNRNRYVDLAVCAIMKNEAPYVKEWLDYHQMVGVKRFYIYDNESSDDLCQVLLPYIRQGIVVYKNYPGEAKQMPAYNEFIKEYGDKNEWVAFIDADEFIIPMEKESIPEFLADYKEYPGVGINWVAYDSNGHKAKPEGGVLENYTRVHYDENLVPFHQIKSIVQPSQVDKIINPHYALFKDNKLAVNENKQEIGGSLEERAYISPFSANKIRINHYFCKSEEEYKAKIERGRAPTKRSIKRVYNQNQVFFDDYKYDYSAYRFVAKLKPEIAQDEELKYIWQKMKNAWIAFKHSFNQNPLYDYIDEKWYFEQYPDAKESGMSAAEHYMNIGWRKGYNPSEKFDTNFYLKKYKDVARMHVCPLLHYLNSGKKEGRLAFEGDTAIHTVQSDTVISAAEQTSHKIEGHTGFSPVSQPTQNNTVITAQSNTVIPATEPVSQPTKNSTVIPTAEPVSLPHLKSFCEWCKTLFKGKEEKYNELWNNNEYFDEDWYVANYAEAGNYKKGPKAHYRTEGWKKGYNPSPLFNTTEYLKNNPDCIICPIDFEYNRNGYKNKNKTKIVLPHLNIKDEDYKLIIFSGYFDAEWYLKKYPDVRKSNIDPVEHYLTIGWKKGYNPSPKFDGNAYLENYQDVAKAEKNPLLHYLQYGQNGKRQIFTQLSLLDKIFNPYKNKSLRYQLVAKSKYFNKVWYLKTYTEVKDKGVDPLEHYLTIGWKRGYNPSRKFDGNAYLEHYQDVKKANTNPLLHYLQYGQNSKRQVFTQPTIWDKIFNLHKNKSMGYQLVAKSGYFNKRWYLKQYPDVRESGLDPIEHYLTIGWKKGYNPSIKFDGDEYIEDYQDVADAGKNPLLHYLQYGKDENRICKEVACSTVRFPANCKKYIYKGEIPSQRIGKIAIFASFSIDGKIDDYVVYYLKSLKKVCDAIIFVADNPIVPKEVEKIEKYVTYAKFERHEEHCFGSYKCGYLYALNNNLLDKAEELIFCNDSFCGPVFPFKKMFDEMVGRKIDFWGVVSNDRNEYYLDKSFLVFKNKVFNTNEFIEFWKHIEKPINVKQFANKYEKELTQKLINQGFTCDSYIEFTNDKTKYPYIFDDNPVYFPLWLLKQGCPLLKIKTLHKYGDNFESVNRVISYLKHKNVELGNIIDKYKQVLAKVKFSVVMPTYNRKDIISEAINSILNQTYQEFELIIVDDGSSDNTYSFVKDKYSKELEKGKIRYYYKENEGVCKARNYGLSKVNNEWITYLDSDNMVYPAFLETFAIAIQENPNIKTFYADMCRISNKKRASRDFDINQMLFANFIDLGVFCHHKTVYDELGGFDENIKRLVDWELILRYTKKYTPYHISKSIMLYNDVDDHTRISNSLNYRDYLNYVRGKHSKYPVITTMITTYNHQDYITEAIESAVKQTGHFIHEIIISDDGSTDDTPKIIAEYAEQYPHLIRNISSDENVGISANMKKCFEAATGEYIAILEGDDYWTDVQKLEKQMKFLEENKDCSMVFSRVRVCNEDTKRVFLLDRHNNLPEKLTGKHFLKEMSLIVNFSCAMYRRDYLQDLPEVLYESRLSEIALAMYLEKKGKIGFISTPLSVYRQNSGGVWSGSDKKKQLQQGLIARQTALKVCADKYKPALQKIIDEQYVKPLKEMEENEQQAKQAV